MVDGVVQRGQLVVRGVVGCLSSIRQQSLLIHILAVQQRLSVDIILANAKNEVTTSNTMCKRAVIAHSLTAIKST